MIPTIDPNHSIDTQLAIGLEGFDKGIQGCRKLAITGGCIALGGQSRLDGTDGITTVAKAHGANQAFPCGRADDSINGQPFRGLEGFDRRLGGRAKRAIGRDTRAMRP